MRTPWWTSYVGDARLADEHRLEAALQGRVLLDVLAVLVQGGRADHAQLAAGEHGLQHVAGVHGALGRARADDGVQLVDEGDDLPVGVADVVQDGLEAVLELAPELCPGDHRAQVEGDDALVLQALGDVTGDHALGQPLDDGGLAHARLADEDRVVLGSAAEHLDDAANLVVAADDGVELAGPGGLGEVAAEPLQGLVLGLGVLVGDLLAPAHVGDGGEHGLAGDAGLGEQLGGRAGALGQRDQEVLGRDVLVLHRRGLAAGALDEAGELRADGGLLAGAVDLRDALDGLGDLGAQRPGVRADLADDREHDAIGVAEQREQQVLGLDPLVVGGEGAALRGGQRLLRLVREVVDVHGRLEGDERTL
jgi:hypothetical protein